MTRIQKEIIGVLTILAILASGVVLLDEIAKVGSTQTFIQQHWPVTNQIDCQ